MEPNCVSYNLKKEASKNEKYKFELNNSTFEGQEDKLERNSEFIYRGAKVREVLILKFKSGKQTNKDRQKESEWQVKME